VATLNRGIVNAEVALKGGCGVSGVAHVDTNEGHVVREFLTQIRKVGGFHPTWGAGGVPEVHQGRPVERVGRAGLTVKGFTRRFGGLAAFFSGKLRSRAVPGNIVFAASVAGLGSQWVITRTRGQQSGPRDGKADQCA